MKNKRCYIFFIFSIMLSFALFTNFNIVCAADDYEYKGLKVNDVETNKTWTINFNNKLDKDTVNNSNIMITDEKSKVISSNVVLKDDCKSVSVKSNVPYELGKTYNVIIKDGLKSTQGKKLTKSAKMEFKIKNAISNASSYTVCIDPGHGGDDLGNVSEAGLKEKDINLAVALKLGKVLESNGVKVVYTRTSDSINWSKDEDLKKRFEIANNSKADYFISLRCNTYENASVNGIETYYSEWNDSSKKLAQNVHEELVNSTNRVNRGIKAGQPYHDILKGAMGNSIMVELGFMSNPSEAAVIAGEDFQNKSAVAVSNGILKSLSLADKNITINSIKDISATATVGEDFKLPLNVQATMSDGSTKSVGVVWNDKSVSTSSAGTYSYKGYVGGYDKEINLTLTVADKQVNPTPSEGDIICIDPGHGIGSDGGASGIAGLQEDDVTLSVGLKVGQILQSYGVKVVYTRTEDLRSNGASLGESLKSRCDISNNANAKYFICIHCNSAVPAAKGTETWLNTENEESKKLAIEIQNSIVEKVGTYNRGLKDYLKDRNGLYVISNTNSPSVLIELAFLSNESDAAKLSSDEYQEKFAQAIVEGILKTLGK